MVRRKGELSSAMIDAGWPHQVALPADACTGKQYVVQHDFCRSLSLCARGHSFRRHDRDYVVFCFAEQADAERFMGQFEGELVRPEDRRAWDPRGRRR